MLIYRLLFIYIDVDIHKKQLIVTVVVRGSGLLNNNFLPFIPSDHCEIIKYTVRWVLNTFNIMKNPTLIIESDFPLLKVLRIE